MSNKCNKINDKKYIERPSPPYHANECKDMIKKGNDNYNYISIRDKNKVYKWEKMDKYSPVIKCKKNEMIEVNNALYYAVEDKDGKYYWEKKIIRNKKTSEEFYKQYPDYKKPLYDISFFQKSVDELKKQLKKIDVNFYLLPSYKWNYSPSEIEQWLSEYEPKGNYIYISDRNLYFDARDKKGIIFLKHDVDQNKWTDVNNILKKIYPDRTIGITTYQDAIKIFCKKQKILTKDIEKNRYQIDIYFKDKTITETQKYVKIINKHIKDIGYVDDYIPKIGRLGYFYVIININHDSEKKFKDIFKKIVTELPKIEKSKISKL